MSSKKKKPAKLRHELQEYTSLIRTLYTTSTQDIVPHLTGSFPPPASVPSSPSKRATSPPASLQNEESSSSDEGPQGSQSRNEKGPRDRKGEGRAGASEALKSMYKDVWTRWPLLLKNVYVPEWTLQDEVKSIAEHAARKWAAQYAAEDEASSEKENEESSSNESKSEDSGSRQDEDEDTSSNSSSEGKTKMEEDMEDDAEEKPADEEPPLPEEDLITKGVLHGLSLETSRLLSHIFGVLAAHRPAVDASLQNRLQAMDWQTSLNIISSAGIIDSSIVESVQERMESIYGPSEIQASERLDVHRRAKRRLKDLEESLGGRVDLFHFDEDTRRGKRRRINR